MKTLKHISLLLLAMSIMVCCGKDDIDSTINESTVTDEISLSDSYKSVFFSKKGHWGLGNDRFSTYPEVIYMRGSTLAVRFEKEIADLKLLLTDSDNQVILNETISVDKNSLYTIPVTFVQDKSYLIEISHNFEYYYLEFFIE